MIAAADTFRAAAIDQLGVWAQRVGVELIAHAQGTDPASVVYDGIAALKQRGADVLLIDTAGRLHNKKNLMDELAKINRVIGKELPRRHATRCWYSMRPQDKMQSFRQSSSKRQQISPVWY